MEREVFLWLGGFIRQSTARIVLANVGLILGAALFGLFARDNTIFSGQRGENPYGLFRTLYQFIKMEEFRYTTAYYLTSMQGFDILLALFMFYIQDSLGYAPNGILSIIFVAIPRLVAMATSVVWDKLSE